MMPVLVPSPCPPPEQVREFCFVWPSPWPPLAIATILARAAAIITRLLKVTQEGEKVDG